MSLSSVKRRSKGPRFIRFFGPVLDALRVLGNSGRPDEIKEVIAEKLQISEESLAETLNSGQGRVSNEIDWARFYLAKAGYLDASKRGVWSLTDEGRKRKIAAHDEAFDLFQEVHRRFAANRQSSNGKPEENDVEETETPPDESPHRTQLLALLKSLPPRGFEELCQTLLRELGFVKVEVLGRTGDGGIDGEGILQVNPLVSIRVVFQSKRYKDTVGVEKIRDFRGAVQGRADKGIIITTGSFSLGAQDEAVRAGAIPIELVDGERLTELFERLGLGLKRREVFDIDFKFFDRFQGTRK